MATDIRHNQTRNGDARETCIYTRYAVTSGPQYAEHAAGVCGHDHLSVLSAQPACKIGIGRSLHGANVVYETNGARTCGVERSSINSRERKYLAKPTFVIVRQVTGIPGAINGDFADVAMRRDIMNC